MFQSLGLLRLPGDLEQLIVRILQRAPLLHFVRQSLSIHLKIKIKKTQRLLNCQQAQNKTRIPHSLLFHKAADVTISGLWKGTWPRLLSAKFCHQKGSSNFSQGETLGGDYHHRIVDKSLTCQESPRYIRDPNPLKIFRDVHIFFLPTFLSIFAARHSSHHLAHFRAFYLPYRQKTEAVTSTGVGHLSRRTTGGGWGPASGRDFVGIKKTHWIALSELNDLKTHSSYSLFCLGFLFLSRCGCSIFMGGGWDLLL